ncbi:MAG: TrmH family RNA methyltransferase [Christensenellales bacterium]
MFTRIARAAGQILVIGSEGQGISGPVRAAATHHLALPMRGGAESLNAAVAAGIMIYEMAREQP